ncbi:MAG: 1,4-dihydroxy-2-naphthoate octaprenyltransferase [Muribaculaceae bacterium]|nr:1,4-dihydroxy-2-naphthoate octaprenyltransferase [Muribaculaceae bacterium]
MNTFKYWIEAMRLRTLPVSVAGVLAAWACAISDGCFAWPQAVLCMVFALLCQIASNFANEYYDYRAGRDRAGRQGPRRGVTEGDLSPEAMKKACFGTLAVAAIVGLSLTAWGGLWLIAAGVAIGLGALAYSAGPWPLSTHCMGEVAVVIFFGLVPVNLTYYLMAGVLFAPLVAAISLAIGLLGANVLIVNNYRDIPDDTAVGKHTLANTLGARTALCLYAFNAVAAAALSAPAWLAAGKGWIAAPIALAMAGCAIALKIHRLSGAALNPFLGITSMLMFVFSLLLLISQCAG